MAKEPQPGRVKTRLAAGIGTVPAAGWFRRNLHATARRLGRDPRWELILAVAPDAALTSRALPAAPRVAQGPGDLGARMARLLRCAPPGPVAIIGGDIPGIRPAHIARAFALMARAGATLGPSSDGGYWLIGLGRRGRAQPAGLFRHVRWSSPHARSDTARSLAPLRVALADPLDDVDVAADLPRSARR